MPTSRKPFSLSPRPAAGILLGDTATVILDCDGCEIAAFTDPCDADWVIEVSRDLLDDSVEGLRNELRAARDEAHDLETENCRLREKLEAVEEAIEGDLDNTLSQRIFAILDEGEPVEGGGE